MTVWSVYFHNYGHGSQFGWYCPDIFNPEHPGWWPIKTFRPTLLICYQCSVLTHPNICLNDTEHCLLINQTAQLIIHTSGAILMPPSQPFEWDLVSSNNSVTYHFMLHLPFMTPCDPSHSPFGTPTIPFTTLSMKPPTLPQTPSPLSAQTPTLLLALFTSIYSEKGNSQDMYWQPPWLHPTHQHTPEPLHTVAIST